MSKTKERKFLTLPLTAEEYDRINDLVVAVTTAKNEPTVRTDIMREALNEVAKQYTGEQIFK